MWGSKSKISSPTRIDTLIGSHTEIRGDIIFKGGLHVDGTIKGNVLSENGSESMISVSEKGCIEGEVRVPKIILNGTVVGNVYASSHIQMAKRTRVTGNVYYNLIEMERGAEINGNLIRQSGTNNGPANKQEKPVLNNKVSAPANDVSKEAKS